MHTYEAVYETGVIKLLEPIRLPERTRVLVVVPDSTETRIHRIASPRLANPAQTQEFDKVVIEELHDAAI